MPRADLSAMLGKLDDPTPSPEVPAAVTGATAAPLRRPAPKSPTTRTRSGGDDGYLSFERKESRLRPDQYARLTEEARRLNRLRSGGTRITENTLIRVAIDLLLERSSQLAGNTEDALRKSVSL